MFKKLFIALLVCFSLVTASFALDVRPTWGFSYDWGFGGVHSPTNLLKVSLWNLDHGDAGFELGGNYISSAVADPPGQTPFKETLLQVAFNKTLLRKGDMRSFVTLGLLYTDFQSTPSVTKFDPVIQFTAESFDRPGAVSPHFSIGYPVYFGVGIGYYLP